MQNPNPEIHSLIQNTFTSFGDDVTLLLFYGAVFIVFYCACGVVLNIFSGDR